MTRGGGFLARIRRQVNAESGFNEDVLFTVRESKFEEKCPRVDIYQLAPGNGQGRGNRRCFGDGRR